MAKLLDSKKKRKLTKKELENTQFGTGYAVHVEDGIKIVIPMKDGNYKAYIMSDYCIEKECQEYPKDFYEKRIVNLSEVVLETDVYDYGTYTYVISLLGKFDNV